MHVASALAYVPPLIQDKNRASLHDIRTDLEERSNFSPLLLEAPLGGTLDRGRGASGSGAARCGYLYVIIYTKKFIYVSISKLRRYNSPLSAIAYSSMD